MGQFDEIGGTTITSPENGQGVAGQGNVSVSFSRGSIRYDSPFLDMTSTFIPRTIKGILKFIAAYVVSDGLLSQCITKMSEYPITSILYGDDDKSPMKDDKTIEKWKNILENSMGILKSLKQSGMDYHAYGNSIVSINYPFKRMLICPRCHGKYTTDGLKAKFENFKFKAECPSSKCGYKGDMEAQDVNTKEISKLGLVHWDLLYIDIKYNSITGDHFYYYTVPADLQFAIRRGDMDIINGTRLEIIRAVEKRKQLKLIADNVFHLKRPGPQYIVPAERGWGIPAVMAVLKDVFHTKVLKKGNEMIAFDHIVPLRILFPQPVGDISPHATISLSDWRSKIEQEIRRWRSDPNYVSIVPVPLGMQNFSGDARLLMISPEIRDTENTIITGMGIIPEIIRGGASWSGSNVSLRVVENSFINHRTDMHSLLRFIVKNVSKYMDIPEISVKMSDFKMADDLEKKKLLINAAMGASSEALVSKTTVQKEMDLDPAKEYKNINEDLRRRIELKVEEAEGNAEALGAAAIVQALYGADAQIEQQKRIEAAQQETQAKHDQQKIEASDQNAPGIQQEVTGLAQQKGHDPNMVSIPNLILIVTQRFARLARIDPDEFKIRMLAMKNSTPSLYTEVYTNLKEMNLIQADTMPVTITKDLLNQGQIPQFAQGGTTAQEQASPTEAGANPGVLTQDSRLPEQRPPRSTSSPI
jgi:hypothetical protein